MSKRGGLKPRAFTEIHQGGAEYARSAKKKLPPLGAHRGGGAQNLNCKFKAFGFFDTLKVNIQFN